MSGSDSWGFFAFTPRNRCRSSWGLAGVFEDIVMATAATTMVKTGLHSFGQSRLASIFKIKELRQKIFITLLFLFIYRVGFHVPAPMIDQHKMAERMRGSDEGLLGLI